MTKAMREKLSKYINDHAATILETAGTKCCELKYKPSCANKNFTFAVAFSKNLHSVDPVTYTIGNAGFAIVLPSYWLSIPVDLTLPYIEYFIDEYMKKEIFGNGSDSGGSNGGSNDTGCNCPVPNPPAIKPPCPKPSLEANLHDDPNNQLSGYFIAGQ